MITEVFHMLMVFFTNMADVRMAFGFVRLCAGPMILANGCAVMCAVALVALLSRRERKPLDREHRQLTQSFSRWLSAVVLVAFCATSVVTWFLQTSWAEDSNRQLLTLNLDDVKQDILDASDANLLELTRGVAADLDAAKTVNGGTLAAICRKPGNDFSEINVVDENGIIMSSTTLSYRGFDMASGEQSSEFLALLDGVQEYVQSYQPVSKDGETYMKYAAVALERGGFVQVGYNAARFRRDIDQRVVGATKNRHVGENGYLIQSWMRSSTTVEYLRMWENTYNPKFQDNACDELIHTVHTTGTTLTPSLWIQSTHAKGIKTSRGKGGGTIAHPESAEMFRAWLFPEFMLDLVQWYRTFHHKDKI